MMKPVRILVLTATLVVACGAIPIAEAGPGAAASSSTCSQSYLPLPDPVCTPGVTNPDVTQASIDQTICVSGWTATVRPPTSYTNPLKAQGIIDYGYTDTSMSDYEEDHFIPLELGGSPRDPGNLWPEPHAGSPNSYSKDTVENRLKSAVCDGEATLTAAQDALVANWTTAESVLGLS
jgi:hypothetical protein